MREPNEQEKQQYERFKELFKVGRQCYLESGGDPRRAADGRYLTDEEKQELFKIGRHIFGISRKDGYVHCQGQSWKITTRQEVSS